MPPTVIKTCEGRHILAFVKDVIDTIVRKIRTSAELTQSLFKATQQQHEQSGQE